MTQTQTQTTSQALLIKMLTENTGKSFLDSGGAYGRQWQQNQKRDFENEPEVKCYFMGGKFEFFTISLYHAFSRILDLDDITDIVNASIEKEDLHWVAQCTEYDNRLSEWLGDGVQLVTKVENSYNYESNLDQVFISQIFQFENEFYLLLQLHGGCDVRGGYTDVKCFRFTDSYFYLEPDVIGNVKGIDVDNLWDGINLTDEDGDPVEFTEDDLYDLQIIPN